MIDFVNENLSLNSDLELPLVQFVTEPLVAILLCTYNGERFLAEQLDSLEAQTHQNWVMMAQKMAQKMAL